MDQSSEFIKKQLKKLGVKEFSIDNSGKTPAIYIADRIPLINHRVINSLKNILEELSLNSTRICLHQDKDGPIHEMIIIHAHSDELPRLHKHLNIQESYHAIYGELKIEIYSDSDELLSEFVLGASGKEGQVLFTKIPQNCWHRTYSLTDVAIFKETRPGPFDPNDTFFQK
jgi:cupin fold WbuC family metalloprotein